MAVRFSDVHGENVALSDDKTVARWSPSYSGGHVFSYKSVSTEDSFDIELDGSGHVDFGITKRDPSKIGDIRTAVKNEDLKKITDVRVHKRTCHVIVKQRIEGEFRKIDFEHSGIRVVGKVKKSEQVWLYVNLKFGNLTAAMKSKNARFHDICGENINFCDAKKSSLKLKVENPAAICCFHRQIHPQEYLKFTIEPVKDDDKIPSKYHVVIGASEIDAKQLLMRDPESFKVGAHAYQPYRWKFVQKFEKAECGGNLQIGLNQTGYITYSHSNEASGEIQVSNEGRSNTVLVLFELFRSSIRIDELTFENAYDYAVAEDLQSSTQTVADITHEETEESFYVDLIADDNNPTTTVGEETPKLRRKMDAIKGKPMSSYSSLPSTNRTGKKTTQLSVPLTDMVGKPNNEGRKSKGDFNSAQQQDIGVDVSCDKPVSDNENKEKSIPKVSSVQNLIQKFSNLEEKVKETSVPPKSPKLNSREVRDENKEELTYDNRKSSDSPVMEVYTSVDASKDIDIYDTCEETPNANVLGDTFQSINVLLNVGKKGKDKKDKKKKR